MSAPHPSRRAFLARLGLGAAAAPFVPLLNASGQEASRPTRLLLVFTPHGALWDAWWPSGGERDFKLGPILEPLERHRPHINILANMWIIPTGIGAPHTKGMPLLWTASPLLEDQTFVREDGSGGRFFGWNSAPSLDQVVANAIGTKTTYKSLELGVRCGDSHPSHRMIYAAAKQPLAPETNPYAMVERLFASAGTKLDQVRADRKSTIDVLAAELDGLRTKGRLGNDERFKLDQHLTAIRTIETRLAQTMPRAGVCAAPSLGDKVAANALENTPQVFDRQMDLIAAAFACDLTRVASLQYSMGDNDFTTYPWLGITRSAHHDITHAGDGDAQAKADLTKIYRWYAERFAYLLDQLAAVKEGNGTLLDNTLVIWGSELGKGNTHDSHPTPFIVAGGAGGRLKGGRALWSPVYTPHNRLLVSACQLMGLPNVQTFGSTDNGKGPLPGLV